MKSNFQIKKKLWGFLVGLCIFFDQFTKYIASYRGMIFLNAKVSFGLSFFGKIESQVVIGTVLLIGVVGLFWLLFFFEGWTVGSALFLSGAISNIVDRFLYSGVRDWLRIPGLQFYNNFADLWIFFGLVFLISNQIFSKKGRHLAGGVK